MVIWDKLSPDAQAGVMALVQSFERRFAIADSRGAEVARHLLGADRRKVVISARFKRYAWIKRRQFCWANLDRDFQAMVDRGGESAEVGRALLGHSERIFDWWHRVRDGTMARAILRSNVAVLRFSFRDDLGRGAVCPCAKTAATCRSCWQARRTCGPSCVSVGSSRRTTTPSVRCGAG
jgi:hypothetical protein